MSEPLRGWRKLAGSSWHAPDDPQFFGDLETDATALLSYVDELRATTGVRVTVTHLIARAVAYGLAQVPELCVRLARGRIHPRESVGFKIEAADTKSAVRIARRGEQAHRADRGGGGPHPAARQGFIVDVAARPAASRAEPRSLADLRPQPRSLPVRYAATRVRRRDDHLGGNVVPLLVLVGAVRLCPVVIGHEVTARPMLTLAEAVQRYRADPGAIDMSTQNEGDERATV